MHKRYSLEAQEDRKLIESVYYSFKVIIRTVELYSRVVKSNRDLLDGLD